MYALEFRTANRHHTWLRCAICETKAPLERVRPGPAGYDAMAYSAYSRNGADRLRKRRSVPLMRYGQKSA